MAHEAFGGWSYQPAESRGFGPEDLEALRDDEELEDIEASLDGGEDFSEDVEASDYEAFDTEGFGEDTEAFDEGEAFEALGDEDFGESEPEHDEAVSSVQYRNEQRARAAQSRADGRNRSANNLNRQTLQVATDVERKLALQLGRIPQPPAVKVEPVGTLSGRGVFRARLPNGRETSIMLSPSPASQVDVNRLNGRINQNHARQARALQVQASALKQLKTAQATANKLHKSELVKFSKDLNKRITDGDAGLDKRIAKEIDSHRKLATKQDTQILRRLAQRQRVAQGHSMVLLSALPLVAAYGQYATGKNANPLNATNAILAGSTLGWMFSNNLVNHLARDSKMWRSVAKVWPYAAPFANAGTVWLALKGAAHNELVSGTATVASLIPADTTATKTINLKTLMGSRYFDTFSAITSPNVVVGLKKATTAITSVKAEVTSGVLTITVTGTAPINCEVNWLVDTRKPTDLITST